MRIRALSRLLAAILTLTLIAAACGDDDIDTAPSGAIDDDGDGGGDGTADSEMTDDDMADDGGEHSHDDDTHDDEASDGDMGDDGSHDHGEAVEFAGDVVPTIAIEVEADPASGINVHVTSTDFTVNPEAASTEHVEGEGHYHLYLDGEKVLRFYNDSIHVAGVPEGEVEVTVELSANDHRAYALDGDALRATTTFTVPEHGHDDHSHDIPVAVEWAGDPVSLALAVEVDPKSGWNAFVAVDGMTLSPENVNGDHVAGEGHLQIYANGQKLGRLYGPATHIAALPEGDVEITVVAYTNDHMPYEIDGEPVFAAATVTVAS
ncbi:MAG: hypothetical protein DHS20C19_28040 [Acidimicrobiales bacterium]|nr:MAG: hypothetical protein DHS20C19_28040 [Acidimicrobiales bacterium]